MNSLRGLENAFWSWRFRRHCAKVGDNLQVTGRCVIYGDGVIDVGDGLFLRSGRPREVTLCVAQHAKLTLGNKVFINQGVRIVCTTEISIGDGCQIGDEVVILDDDFHPVDGARRQAHVRLEENVWLATRVIVLRGVTIGRGSIVGAGSVVTRSIPAFTFAAGAPAREIRKLHFQA